MSSSAPKVVKDFLRKICCDNATHVAEIDTLYQDFITAVHLPIATVVMCADSRVQKAAFDKETSNDLFIVRNIGNQIITCEGSVDYGVLSLKTPILMIVGHPQCGAVRACLSGFDGASRNTQAELKTMGCSGASSVSSGVIDNVHHQVSVGCNKFADLITEGKLTVLGAIYDFRNEFKRGHGRFILIDVNGERNYKKIALMFDDIGDSLLDNLMLGP